MVSVFKPQCPKLNFAAPNLFVHLAVNLPQRVPRIAYPSGELGVPLMIYRL